jgi:4-amino-4-deoxy-L-arabinose transferase-like glycosyltransferase
MNAWQDLSPRRFAAALAIALLLASALRGLFPAADPPWRATVGIVWHDEGAWVHNARNKALFGEWRLDAWNPVFIAPVFTGLEYAAFRGFGVGLRQARLVSQVAGVLTVLLVGLAVARISGRRAGLVAAALMATAYVHVMYSRAAIMEAAMLASLVGSWYAVARSGRSPAWGFAAGLLAWAAFFTKASAAFFVAGLGVVSAVSVVEGWVALRSLRAVRKDGRSRAGLWGMAGLALGGAVALGVFVAPYWDEYQFYNWQMSVTRRPSYTLQALIDRASWFPVVHDFFTRMWLPTVVSVVALFGAPFRWRSAGPAERLLWLWLALGTLQLLARDVGNERYFVYLVPALVALAAVTLGGEGRLLPERVARLSRARALLALPFVAYAAYVVCGPITRLPFLYEVRPSVRLSALAAVLVTATVYATWPRIPRLLSATPVGPRVVGGLLVIMVAGDLVQYAQWVAARTYKNYDAMRLVGARLPAGTLVHGKLANGLALESGIRPVFIGHGFGNFADRLERDDIRYVLTYVAPRVGYEGDQILEVLDAYPARRVLWEVDVAETTTGHDRAALIDKRPGSPAEVTR